MQYKLQFYRPLPTPIGADPKLSKIIEKMGCQGIEPWLFRLKAGCITILPTTQMYCPDRNRTCDYRVNSSLLYQLSYRA